MQPSLWQLALVAVVVVLLFGRGKISGLMGDVAKGITSFKKGLKEEDDSSNTIDHAKAETVDASKDKTTAS